MKPNIILRLASKSLFGKRLRSFLTIGGVIVGIGAIVFLVSLAYGLQNVIIEKATGLEALKIIDVASINTKVVQVNDDAISRFKQIDSVVSAEAVINIPGQISFSGSSTDTVVYGASQKYLQLGSITLAQGAVYADGSDEIIVNTSILKLIGVNEEEFASAIGKEATIAILIPQEILPDGVAAQKIEKTFKIVGFIDDNESSYIYVPIKIFTDYGVTNYSQAKVEVTDSAKVAEVRQIIESIGYKTNSAADTVTQIDQIFSIFRIILASFGSIALVVAALGMFNTLTVSLLERTREVGLMKALGARKKDVFSLFLFESMIISGTGGLLGILLGHGLGELFDWFLYRLAMSTGNESVSIFHTPPIFAAGMFMFALTVGFLTGIYPSRRASGLNPLDALRFE